MKRNNDDEGGGEETNIENKKKKQQQLPEELIIEILLRLPVKSLLRFKCVCKSWLSLISDPLFATSHFDLNTNAHTHRLLFITVNASETRSIDYQASLNDDAASVSLNLQFMLPQSYLQIGGSCRGFLFLYGDENFYLWNPSTGIHKQIPCSPSEVNHRFYTYLYSLGYDPSTDDYFMVLGYNDLMDANVLTYFEFFSLRANTWKQIEGAHWPYMDAFHNPRVGTLFNGAIHWLACRANLSVIIAFDLIERRISEIALPPDNSQSYEPSFCELWVFGGFMSLWASEDNIIEIWVMKEHGVSSSWTKTFVFPIDEDLPFYPICSTNDGDIVGSDGSTRLVKYNDIGQLLEHRSYCNHPYGSRVALYTESLLQLPLPRDTQQA